MTHQPLDQFRSSTVARWVTRLVFVVLCVIVGLLGVGFVQMAWREHEINQMIAQQVAVNEAQRAQNEKLKAEAQYRESDAYAELAAREQLGMAREGETVLLPTMVTPPLPQSSPEPGASPAPAPSDVDQQPNYLRWWHALFPPQDSNP